MEYAHLYSFRISQKLKKIPFFFHRPPARLYLRPGARGTLSQVSQNPHSSHLEAFLSPLTALRTRKAAGPCSSEKERGVLGVRGSVWSSAHEHPHLGSNLLHLLHGGYFFRLLNSWLLSSHVHQEGIAMSPSQGCYENWMSF